MPTNEERIEKLEQEVERIERFLSRLSMPALEPLNAKVAALEKRLQAREERIGETK